MTPQNAPPLTDRQREILNRVLLKIPNDVDRARADKAALWRWLRYSADIYRTANKVTKSLAQRKHDISEAARWLANFEKSMARFDEGTRNRLFEALGAMETDWNPERVAALQGNNAALRVLAGADVLSAGVAAYQSTAGALSVLAAGLAAAGEALEGDTDDGGKPFADPGEGALRSAINTKWRALSGSPRGREKFSRAVVEALKAINSL